MLLRTLQGAGVVALGTAVGQGIVLCATPYLARIYSPAEFGGLALISTVSNIAMAVACLRYDLALPSAEPRDARALFKLSAICATGVALATMLLLVAFDWLSARPPPAPLSVPLVIGACIVFAGLQQASIGYALRRRSYPRMAAVRLSQGAAFSAMAAMPAIGLVWAHALSFLVALLPTLRATNEDAGDAGRSLAAAAREHRQFPLQSLPGAVLDVVGYSVCIWLLTAAYGSSEAGQYAQVQRIVGAPLMLVSISIGQVMLRQTADFVHQPQQMRRFIARVLQWLVLLAVAMLTVIALVGEPALRGLLGSKWRVNTMFVMPIALAVFVRACVSPLSSVLITLRRFDLALRWQSAYFVSACTVLAFSAFHFDLEHFVFIYAAHECIFYGAYLALITRAIR